jgi:hypothetical protein
MVRSLLLKFGGQDQAVPDGWQTGFCRGKVRGVDRSDNEACVYDPVRGLECSSSRSAISTSDAKESESETRKKGTAQDNEQ